MTTQPEKSGDLRVVLIGGGNIGSSVAPQIARMPSVSELWICDPDSYTQANLQSQGITVEDVGKSKAVALAEHCRKIRPSLNVQAIVASVQDVPLGNLRKADLILSATDSRVSRQAIGQLCCRLGLRLVDAGVHAADLLARVSVYIPGLDAPCVECGFSQKDYEIIDESYTCDGRLKPTPPGGASFSLGTVAASLQVIEAQKLLEGGEEEEPVSRQILLEARRHHLYVSPLRRNPKCRFNHKPWAIEVMPLVSGRLGDLVDTGRRLLGGKPPASVGFDGRAWVRRMVCACGGEVRVLALQGRLGTRLCACGNPLQPQGFSLTPRLDLNPTSTSLDLPLRELGLLDGDVVELADNNGEQVYVELAGL